MPSYDLPGRPRVSHKSTIAEVAAECNRLLGKDEVLALLDEKTLRTLNTGRMRDRIDAIYKVNLMQLEAAREAAQQSPMSQHISREQQDALAYIKAEPGMSAEARNRLLDALYACRNFELDSEEAEERAKSPRKQDRGPKALRTGTGRRVVIA